LHNIHQLKYVVRPYDAGYLRVMRPGALLDYLQDAAFEHSVSKGFSVFDLIKRGLTWVLSRYHIVVKRYPMTGERVTVRTWYPGHQKPFYLRDWDILDRNGDAIALATSSWLILEKDTMKPAEIGGLLDELEPRPVRALDDPFLPFPEMGAPHFESMFRVRIDDTDINRHVNHVHYIQWALESAEKLAKEGAVPLEMEAGYRAEARFGDNVIARVRDMGEGFFHHQLLRESDGKELTRLRTRWKLPDL